MNPEEATKMLAHYFRSLYAASGFIWDQDNDAEIANLIDQILSEPRQVIRMLRAEIVNLSGRIDRLDDMHRNVEQGK